MLTYYLVSVGILFIYATLLFLLGSIKKNNSIIDAFYGPLFILTGITLVGISYLNDYSISTPALSILFLIAIWGTRLGLRIYRKNRDKEEDFRYKNWRDLWMKRGAAYFFLRSYFQIYLLQGFIISIVLLPFTLSLFSQSPLSYAAYFGGVLWVLGFFFESVGDFQLDRFVQDKNPLKGTIMQSGLWKYTRHPNYFGESMMW